MNERFFKMQSGVYKAPGPDLAPTEETSIPSGWPCGQLTSEDTRNPVFTFFFNKNLKKHAEILFSTLGYCTQQRVQEKIFFIVNICFNF
jgi:hypothetical protein